MQALEINEKNLAGISFCLEKSLSQNPGERNEAEVRLSSFRGKPGYGLLLLRVVHLNQYDKLVRLAASTTFKNYVKQCWENGTILDAEKEQIRSILPPFMLNVPTFLQKLISACLCIISEIDFPKNWPDLLPGLVQQLKSSTDFQFVYGILKVINSIFKRYRHLYNTDDVLEEIKYILESFYTQFLETFKWICQSIESNNNADSLFALFSCLKVACHIFYSLNSVDLPEQFEDNMPFWFPAFVKFLTYETQLTSLLEGVEEDASGLLHKVQATIISNGNLYMEKYEAEFQPFLPPFVSAVWTLLIKTPNKPKFDPLVINSIQFLSSISRSVCYELLKPSHILTDICKNIVVPNIILRKSDIYMFEDDPMEYVKKDLEGSDIGTRRRSAFELVKGLRKNFEKEVTGIFAQHISELLVEYHKDPARNWTSKDAAIYLITSLAVTRASLLDGVTGINELVPIKDFYKTQVIPELMSEAGQPLLKVSCLSFINNFRRQFSGEDFEAMLPHFIRYLNSPNFVVRSYASICLDRFLLVRDKTSEGGPSGGFIFRFGRPILKPFLGSVLQALLIALGDDNIENPYVMKAIARVLSISKEDALPYAEITFSTLVAKLEKIYRAPTIPEFGYYLFEAIACTISTICKSNLAKVDWIENFLLPIFSKIITDGRADVYSPFAFQLMAYLLELRPGTLPSKYCSLLKELTSPTWWQQQGNVPALTRLLQAYVASGSDFIISEKLLYPILGVFQKLLSSVLNDQLGFELLQTIVTYVPITELGPTMKDIFNLIFMRIHSKKTTKLLKGFIVCLSHIINTHGPQLAFQTITSVQAGIFSMVLQSVCFPHVESLTDKRERTTAAVAMTHLLTGLPEMLEKPLVTMWPTVFAKNIHLLEGLETETKVSPEDLFDVEDESGGYTSGFSTLKNAPKQEVNKFKDTDPKKLMAKSFAMAMHTSPQLKKLVQDLGDNYRQALNTYYNLAGIPWIL